MATAIILSRSLTAEINDALMVAGLQPYVQDGALLAETEQDAAAIEAFVDAWVDPLPPVPPSVSLRQLLAALVAANWISQTEALAAARTGDLPVSLEAQIKTGMSADDAFALDLAWAAMYSAERASPFWAIVVAQGVATSDQIDDVFRAAALI